MAKRNDQTISALMIGPARVGKSSVLASMLHSLECVKAETGISFVPDNTTSILMQEKLANLERIYDLYSPGAEFATQDGTMGSEAYAAATEERSVYRFALNVRTVQKQELDTHLCDVEFTDIRGEDLTYRQSDVIARMQKSDVILIAIDAVALMECNAWGGTHNELINYPAQIHKIIKAAYTQNEKPRQQMVLLVPLKCEKYYWERGGMERLNARVKEAYKSLLTLLEANDSFTAAITPILTLGDVQFSRFADGNAYQPLYRFRTKDEYGRPHTPAYSPRFCDQPLCYIVTYILSLIGMMNARMNTGGKQKKNLGQLLLSTLKTSFIFVMFGTLGLVVYVLYRQFLKKPEIRLKLTALAAKIKLDSDGYELLKDGINIKSNVAEIRNQAQSAASCTDKPRGPQNDS